MNNYIIQPALLTRTEMDWLKNKIQLSNGYQRKSKSDIRRKLRIFNELELPSLVKSGLVTATANCNAVTSNCNANYQTNSTIDDNCAQKVGRKGCVTISVLKVDSDIGTNC